MIFNLILILGKSKISVRYSTSSLAFVTNAELAKKRADKFEMKLMGDNPDYPLAFFQYRKRGEKRSDYGLFI